MRHTLLLFVLFWCSSAAFGQGTYTTSFPSPSENPISEAGKWQTPDGTANQWGDVAKTAGFAHGVTQPTTYGDATAILTGTWGATQNSSETISIPGATPAGCCSEVSLRYRMTITANNINGYELLCPVWTNPGYGYQIVRWNGGNGNFMVIGSGTGAHQCLNGDVLSGNISGTNPVNINFYNNGVLVATACDNGGGNNAVCGGFTYTNEGGIGGPGGPFTSGSPGFGFCCGTSQEQTFGISQFMGSDGGASGGGPFVQAASAASSGSATSISVALPSVGVHHALAVIGYWGSNTTMSVSNTLGSSWIIVNSGYANGTSPSTGIAVTCDTGAMGGSDTISVNLGAAASFRYIGVMEVSGRATSNCVGALAGAVTDSKAQSTTGTATPTSANFTTPNAADFLIGMFGSKGGCTTWTAGTDGAGNAYTVPTGGTQAGVGMEYVAETTAGTRSASITCNASSAWNAHLVDLIPVGGSGGAGGGGGGGGPGTYTSATCNQADVNGLINNTGGSQQHQLVNGDKIIIAAGNCGWSAGITIPANINNVTIQGTGTENTNLNCTAIGGPGCGPGTTSTVINTNFSGTVWSATPTTSNTASDVMRISLMEIEPGTSANAAGIFITGTCTAAGCPKVRIDNIRSVSTTVWNNAGFTHMLSVVGVMDHNIYGNNPSGNSTNNITWMDSSFGHWQGGLGLSNWGDASWAAASSFGTDQALYLENNIFQGAVATDSEGFDSFGNWGSPRIVCRFNLFTPVQQNGACTGHGTDTGGRPRGTRQWEAYGNIVQTSAVLNSNNQLVTGNSAWPGRAGVGRAFSNQFVVPSGGAQWKGGGGPDTQRRWRVLGVWGTPSMCDGSNAWDANDGGGTYSTIYYTGTIGTVVNQSGQQGSIGPHWIITDSNASVGWTVNQWAPYGAQYSFHDTKSGNTFGNFITTNTSNSFTLFTNDNGGTAGTPVVGDTYQILRAQSCLDQTGNSGGLLVKDSSLGPPLSATPVLASTGQPGPVNQTIDPVYEANETFPAAANHTYTAGGNTTFLRQIYSEAVNQPAESPGGLLPFVAVSVSANITTWSCTFSPSSCTVTVPSTAGFAVGQAVNITETYPSTAGNVGTIADGTALIASLTATTVTVNYPALYANTATGTGGRILTTGAGHGTLANRPTNCTPSVGYWATDQGTWNQSGNGWGNGQLYVCTATNTWTLNYTPYIYPHPLVGSGVTGPAVSFTPTSVNFGTVAVGQSATQSFTVNSIGSSNLVLGTPHATITTGNAGDFSLVGGANNCVDGQSLAPGTSCNKYISFAPGASGARTSQFNLSDNAPGSPQPVALSGTGAATAAGISFNPPSLSFGSQLNGVASSQSSITVTNTGTANLVITGISTSSADFAQLNNCATVAPNATCIINVTFAPTAAGARSGSILVADNAPASPQSISLTGTGVVFQFSPSSIAYANTVQGKAVGQTVTVLNPGTSTLTVTSITATFPPGQPADFTETDNCVGGVAPNSSCSILVIFAPSAQGAESAVFTMIDGAAGSPHTFNVSGNGVIVALSGMFGGGK